MKFDFESLTNVDVPVLPHFPRKKLWVMPSASPHKQAREWWLLPLLPPPSSLLPPPSSLLPPPSSLLPPPSSLLPPPSSLLPPPSSLLLSPPTVAQHRSALSYCGAHMMLRRHERTAKAAAAAAAAATQALAFAFALPTLPSLLPPPSLSNPSISFSHTPDI